MEIPENHRYLWKSTTTFSYVGLMLYLMLLCDIKHIFHVQFWERLINMDHPTVLSIWINFAMMTIFVKGVIQLYQGVLDYKRPDYDGRSESDDDKQSESDDDKQSESNDDEQSEPNLRKMKKMLWKYKSIVDEIAKRVEKIEENQQ